MKRKLAVLLTLVMIFTTCFTAFTTMAEVRKYSDRWSISADGRWQIVKNGVVLKNTWIYDDECDVAEGLWYLIDENGYLVHDELIRDAHGRYYSFRQEHDGHFGAMRTQSGIYNGITLTFAQTHDGSYGSITNPEGIEAMTARYGVREMKTISNPQAVRLSEVKQKSSSGSSDDPAPSPKPDPDVYYTLSFDLGDVTVTKPDDFASVRLKSGSRIAKPATPSDAAGERVFISWNDEEGEVYDFDEYEYYILEDGTLYAQWNTPDYLSFTANTAGSTVSFRWLTGSDVQTSTDGGATWEKYYADDVITLENVGDTVSFRGINVTTGYDDELFNFTMTGSIAADGSVTSLTDGLGGNPNVKLQDACYKYMFMDCTALTDAPEIIAVGMTKDCCFQMFSGCTSLVNVQEKLPARKLADYCYAGMFKDCEALTDAPEIEAAEMAADCCNSMFSGCTSLVNVQAKLSAAKLAERCYTFMFMDCKALKNAPEIEAAEMAASCCDSMFYKCTSLENVQAKLPAAKLEESCYEGMFSDCAALITAPEIEAAEMAERCCNNMFSGCTSLENVQATLPAATMAKECCLQMFKGCTALTTAPEIEATELAEDCCRGMFSGCSSLENVQATLPAATMAPFCYSQMFEGCTSLTTAPEIAATTVAKSCFSNMFNGCTSLTTAPRIEAATTADHCCYKMFYNCSQLKIKEGGSGTDRLVFTCPTSIQSQEVTDMFKNTGGSFTGTPAKGNSYYYYD